MSNKKISKNQAKARKSVGKRNRKADDEEILRSGLTRILSVPLMILQIISAFVFLFTLNRLNMLAGWQFGLVLVVVLGLIGFNLYKLFISKQARRFIRWICLVLALLASVFCIVGYHYSQSVVSFVENITGARYETETYSVYVMKDSGYKELDYLKRQSIGYLSTNPHRAETESQLQRVVSHKTQEFESIGEMVSALYDSSVSAVVMNNSYLDMLAETEVDFEEKTRVLYTFEVRSDVADVPKEVDIKTEPFVMLISGSDSRVGLEEVARSDVNMLAVVNPKEHKILLVSIPRDYYVQLHGTTGTKDKLTHAGVYGIEMSRKTIEDLFDIDINYTTKVSFGTVVSVVDALGGIEIDSDRAFTAYTNKSCQIQQGVQTLDSACALAYARERYAYESGDRHRVQNQQDVTEAILKKLSDPRYLAKYPKILKSAEGSFETSMSYDMITDFAKTQLASLHPWTIEKISVDGTGAMLPTYSMGAQNLYVMIPDQSTVDAAKAKIQEYLSVSEPEAEQDTEIAE